MIAKFVTVLVNLWERIKASITPAHLTGAAINRNNQPNSLPLLTLHRRGSKFYFAANLDPLGYWTDKELQSLLYFVEQVSNGRLQEISFPALRRDEQEPKEGTDHGHKRSNTRIA